MIIFTLPKNCLKQNSCVLLFVVFVEDTKPKDAVQPAANCQKRKQLNTLAY